MLGIDEVKDRLENDYYQGKIHSLDYANNGHRPFDARNFARDLGVHKTFLEDIGLIQTRDVSGWNLPTAPSPDELDEAAEEILAERERLENARQRLHVGDEL